MTERGGFGRDRHPRACQADHRGRRRARPGRRHRDRPVLRPRRRVEHRHLRDPRGEAQPGRRRRGLFRLPRKIPRNIAMELRTYRRPDVQRRACGIVRVREPAVRRRRGRSPPPRTWSKRVHQGCPARGSRARTIILEATDQPDEVGWKLSGDGMSEDVRDGRLRRRHQRLHREARPGLEGSLRPAAPPAQVNQRT